MRVVVSDALKKGGDPRGRYGTRPETGRRAAANERVDVLVDVSACSRAEGQDARPAEVAGVASGNGGLVAAVVGDAASESVEG